MANGKKTLKKEVLLYSLTVIISSLLLLLILSETTIYTIEKSKVIHSSQEKTSLFADQTNQIISNIRYNIKAFSTSQFLQNSLVRNYPAGKYGDYLFDSAMKNSIINTMDIQNIISDGEIISSDQKIYYVSSNSTDKFLNEDQKILFDKMKQGNSSMLISLKEKNDGNCLNIIKKILEIQTGNFLGIISFDIKNDIFQQKYEIGISNNEEVFFIDKKGNYIDGTNKKAYNEFKSLINQNKIYELKKKGYLFERNNIFSMKELDNDMGYIIYQINKLFVYQGAIRNGLIILLLGIIIITISVIIFSIISSNISKPVVKLTNYALKVSDKKKSEIPKDVILREDEIGKLSQCINQMVISLNKLSNEVFIEQNKKREYELQLLQSQINPHFLYNCFDNLNTLIADDRKEDSFSMVKYLERYYRSILSKGRSVITIDEELFLVENYLKIQQIKTPLKFKYMINISENLKQYRIFKMCLQPIVENSVMHGFNHDFKKIGMIEINISENQNDIFIDVIDNGLGINEDNLNTIFDVQADSIPNHFGLRNIKQRIELMYGKKYGIRVESKLYKGTTVKIKIPKRI